MLLLIWRDRWECVYFFKNICTIVEYLFIYLFFKKSPANLENLYFWCKKSITDFFMLGNSQTLLSPANLCEVTGGVCGLIAKGTLGGIWSVHIPNWADETQGSPPVPERVSRTSSRGGHGPAPDGACAPGDCVLGGPWDDWAHQRSSVFQTWVAGSWASHSLFDLSLFVKGGPSHAWWAAGWTRAMRPMYSNTARMLDLCCYWEMRGNGSMVAETVQGTRAQRRWSSSGQAAGSEGSEFDGRLQGRLG